MRFAKVKIRNNSTGRINSLCIDYLQVEYVERKGVDTSILHMKSGSSIEIYQAYELIIKEWKEAVEKSNNISKLLDDISSIKDMIAEIKEKL